ncbi:MAG: AMP-binding protein [Bdellovibrionales bacterium]|nr:AMP-binding protein [Bdellovibrionales bacterium]
MESLSEKKNWLKNYPKGVPETINPERYESVRDLIEESFLKFSNKTSYSCMGKDYTFSEIDEMSKNFASFLQNQFGLVKGDRIAIQMPNILQYPVALFGALRAGLIVVNTNPLYTAREMKHQFNDSGAKAIVILANFAHQLEEIMKETSIENVVITELGDLLGFPKSLVVNNVVKYVKKMVPKYKIKQAFSFDQALKIGADHSFQKQQILPEDLAFLQYTGGTTGVAKGAMLTNRNIIANMLQIAAWLSPNLKERDPVICTPLPLYHVFSLTVNCMAMMYFGAKNLLIPNPRDMAGFIKVLKQEKVHIFTGVNTLYNGLLNQPDFKDIDFSEWQICVAGAMALQSNVSERWEQVTGLRIAEGYGLTETSPVASVNPIDGTARVGFIGLPVPSTSIKLMNQEGQECQPGEPGEIWISGPQVMKGYWQKPEDSNEVLTEDGWFKSGDIAVADDDGYFKIVDRKKDMILVSGFNVYPNEVEDVVATHPDVVEVAAIGVPDEKSGEAVKIFVVSKNKDLTAKQLIQHCREGLTGYKIPKYVEFREDLPKTNVGKILRRELRA